MHVLFLSYDGLTDPLGQSQILPYLLSLQSEDTKVSVISAEKGKRFQSEKELIRKMLGGVNIEWEPISWSKNPPILSTVKDAKKMYNKAVEIHRRNPVDLIHSRGYISALSALRAKRKLNIPYIFDIRGFFPDERVDGGVWNLKNPAYKAVYRYFKKKEKHFFENASHVISLTHRGKGIIDSNFKLTCKTTVIPCATDFDHFTPDNITETSRNDLREKLNINTDDYVLSYLGSLGTWYLLNDMLLFFKELLLEKPTAKFLFITNDTRSMIEQTASSLGVPTDRLIVTSTSRASVPLYLSLSDANIFFIKPCFSKQASSPTKMGEAMAMGIPLICNSGVGDVATIIKQSKAGIVIDLDVPDSFRSCSKEFLSMSFHRSDIRSAARDIFDLAIAVKAYKKSYKDALRS